MVVVGKTQKIMQGEKQIVTQNDMVGHMDTSVVWDTAALREIPIKGTKYWEQMTTS